MNAPHAVMATRVAAAAAGALAAQRLVHELRRGDADVDALHEALQAELAHEDPERLRGFMRELQKRLEGQR